MDFISEILRPYACLTNLFYDVFSYNLSVFSIIDANFFFLSFSFL